MDCKVCNPRTNDDNVCDYHSRLLKPLLDWMLDETGNDYWSDDTPLKVKIHGSDIDKVAGFLAGAQMPVAVIVDSGFGTRAGKITATSNPQFEFLQERDWP